MKLIDLLNEYFKDFSFIMAHGYSRGWVEIVPKHGQYNSWIILEQDDILIKDATYSDPVTPVGRYKKLISAYDPNFLEIIEEYLVSLERDIDKYEFKSS